MYILHARCREHALGGRPRHVGSGRILALIPRVMRAEDFRPIAPPVDLVIPTVGRPSLALLLASIDGPPDRLPSRVIVVDHRRSARDPLPMSALSPELRARLDVVASHGRSRAAARNLGWQASRAAWIAFLDEDVVPCRGWSSELRRDLDAVPPDVAGIRGRVLEPMGGEGSTTDCAANIGRGDVAYRTSALRRLGGFDERFTSAGRADTDLARRAEGAGLRFVAGRRTVMHPAWPARRWTLIQAAWHRLVDRLKDALRAAAPRAPTVNEPGSRIVITHAAPDDALEPGHRSLGQRWA